jgi:hypothetical protein
MTAKDLALIISRSGTLPQKRRAACCDKFSVQTSKFADLAKTQAEA